MNVTVKLFAYFRENRFFQEEQSHSQGTHVGDIVDQLGISRDEVGVLMLNNKHCSFSTPLSPEDTLAIFPVIGGG